MCPNPRGLTLTVRAAERAGALAVTINLSDPREATRGTDRLHVQGAVVLDGADPAVLRRVLTRACGRVTDQGAAPRQVCLKDLWQASGWSACLRKGHRRTRRVLGAPDVRLTYVSRSLARMARELHQEGQQTPARRPQAPRRPAHHPALRFAAPEASHRPSRAASGHEKGRTRRHGRG